MKHEARALMTALCAVIIAFLVAQDAPAVSVYGGAGSSVAITSTTSQPIFFKDANTSTKVIEFQRNADTNPAFAVTDDGSGNTTVGCGTGACLVQTVNGPIVLNPAGTPNLYLGNGAIGGNNGTNASPSTVVFQATGGLGTNIAGAPLVLAPGISTGSAAPAAVVLRATAATGSGTTQQTLADSMWIWQNGQTKVVQATAPTGGGGSCGTGSSIAAGSSDARGSLTVGTGTPTSCTVTFNKTWPTAPICMIAVRAASATAFVASVSTTVLTITVTTTNASNVIDYDCKATATS